MYCLGCLVKRSKNGFFFCGGNGALHRTTHGQICGSTWGAGWESGAASVRQERDAALLAWVTAAVILHAHSRNSDEREAGSRPPRSVGDGCLLRRQSQGSPLLVLSPHAADGMVWGPVGVARHRETQRGAPRCPVARRAQPSTDRALLLSPRAGTSCPSGRTGRGRRRPGRMAGTATTMSSWT